MSQLPSHHQAQPAPQPPTVSSTDPPHSAERSPVPAMGEPSFSLFSRTQSQSPAEAGGPGNTPSPPPPPALVPKLPPPRRAAPVTAQVGHWVAEFGAGGPSGRRTSPAGVIGPSRSSSFLGLEEAEAKPPADPQALSPFELGSPFVLSRTSSSLLESVSTSATSGSLTSATPSASRPGNGCGSEGEEETSDDDSSSSALDDEVGPDAAVAG
eukprot:RCo044462